MRFWGSFFLMALAVQGCQTDALQHDVPLSTLDQKDVERGRLFGQQLTLGGEAPGAISVNPHIWQAALDTLTFMDFEEVDLASGLLETAWYSPPDAPQERFKVLVTVLGGHARTNSARATVLVQHLRQGAWGSSVSSRSLAREIEEKIVHQARFLKSSSGIR